MEVDLEYKQKPACLQILWSFHWAKKPHHDHTRSNFIKWESSGSHHSHQPKPWVMESGLHFVCNPTLFLLNCIPEMFGNADRQFDCHPWAIGNYCHCGRGGQERRKNSPNEQDSPNHQRITQPTGPMMLKLSICFAESHGICHSAPPCPS